MAAKTTSRAKTAYVCGECGGEHNKWQGQCGECGAWNSLSEIVLESAAAVKSPAGRRSSWAGKVDAALQLLPGRCCASSGSRGSWKAR